ncbi:MAG: ubiquinone/menaquinone biosynthesis methyltransferase [Phycisphaerales bacterium]|nr:ubiquinone/menaquinone biosynthesis methyltransferase [Phycisphaerales bacterium]
MPNDRPKQIWDAALLESVHGRTDKADRVRRMFDAIAPTYERVNAWASLGQDRVWRREMVRLAAVRPDDVLLDVASGTGDVLRAFSVADTRPAQLIGLDFSHAMLLRAARGPLAHCLFCQADALAIPLPEQSVSIVTCAFGIRNFQDLGAGFREMQRVLRPGGRVVLLEFSLPEHTLLRRMYLYYIQKLMPYFAGFLSGDRTGAYRYLPQSVVSFESSQAVRARMKTAGFSGITEYPLTGGVVTIYMARKSSGK